MEIQSNKLQRIFKYLAPSIGSVLKNAEYNSFLFDATSDNLMVRAYNGVTESIVNMSGQFEPMRFAVDEFIYQIVNQLSGDIKFELDDTNLVVDCGAKHYEFSTVDCELWQPAINDLPKNKIDDLRSFKNMFDIVRHCATREESQHYNGYRMINKHLIATDGFRGIITSCNYGDFGLFPQKEIDSILRCLDGTVSYNFDEYIYFRCEDGEFVISYMTSNIECEPVNMVKFIEEKEQLPINLTITFDNLQRDLKDIVVLQKQASVIGDSKFKLVASYKNNELYFITEIQNFSNSEQKIESDARGIELDVGFYPNQLMDFAKISQGKITIKIIDGYILLYDENETKGIIREVTWT